MSVYNAAIAAGYPQSILKRPNRPNRLQATVPTVGEGSTTNWLRLFDQKAMTDTKKAEAILDGMKAMKTIVVDHELVEVPDHAIRHKNLETMLKLCKQLTTDNKTTNNTLILEGDFAKKMRNARERATEIMKAEFVKGVGEQAPAANIVRDDNILDVTVIEKTHE